MEAVIEKKHIYLTFLIALILAISFILFSSIAFAQDTSSGGSSNSLKNIEIPKDTKDLENLGDKAIETTKTLLPGVLNKIWNEQVIPIWQKMADYIKNLWTKHFAQSFDGFLQKLEDWLGVTFKERKELTKQKFEKEKEEFSQEAPKLGKTLWEKFWELIK